MLPNEDTVEFCIFYNSLLSDGITVVETDPTGVIWLKLCKHFFHYEHDVYVCSLIYRHKTLCILIYIPVGFLKVLKLV